MRGLILVLLLVSGCGSTHQEALKAYQEAFRLGEFARASELLEKTQLKVDKRSRLLWLMERGRLHYAQGAYPQAAQVFNEALELVDAQYTKSLTREGSKWVISESSGDFFGAPFERSWLHYHLALSHWNIYQAGGLAPEEARRHLFSARAALLAWDSFFQDWQRSTEGKTLYRHDVSAKVIAAQVHEATGAREDKQIALQLYKDAWKLMQTLGLAYSAFNEQAPSYLSALETSLQRGENPKTSTEWHQPTELYQGTRQWLLQKIVTLTRELRPAALAELPLQLGLSASDITAIKSVEAQQVFILEEGVTPGKSAEEINLGVKGVAKLAKDDKTRAQIARVGAEVVAAFAVNTLGLRPRNVGAVGRFTATHSLLTVAAHEAAVAFEIPTIVEEKKPRPVWLVVKEPAGREVARAPWNVLTHLSDVAKQNVDEESAQRILRTGVRVVTKHLSAIVAAMALYQSMAKKGEENLLAKYAAIASYVAATKGIALSERADTRSWRTLPGALRVVDLKLAPGDYVVELAEKAEQNGLRTLRALGPLKVGSQRAIFTYLIPQL